MGNFVSNITRCGLYHFQSFPCGAGPYPTPPSLSVHMLRPCSAQCRVTAFSFLCELDENMSGLVQSWVIVSVR